VTVTVTSGGVSATSAVLLKTFSPRAVSSLAIGDKPRRLAKGGERLYVAAQNGLIVVDVSRPLSPRALAAIPMECRDVAALGDIAIVATPSGLVFLDLADPRNPQQVGSVPLARIDSVSLDAGTLYATAGSTVFAVKADIPTVSSLLDRDGDGADDRILGSLDLGFAAGRLSVGQGLAAVAGANALTVVDVSNPQKPRALPSLTLAGGQVLDVETDGRTIFAVTKSNLVSVDVGTPSAPKVLGSTTALVSPLALSTLGELAFVVDALRANATAIYPIADPTRLEPAAGSIDFSGLFSQDAVDILADRNFVYAINESGGLEIGQYLVYNDAGFKPPEVFVTSPSGGATFTEGAKIRVEVRAEDDVGVDFVELLVDGKAVDKTATWPYALSAPAPSASQKTAVKIEARATDFGGNVGLSGTTEIVVVPDSGPPAVSIVTPASGAKVSGSVLVIATATDDGEIAEVEFLLDGAKSLKKLTTSPYAFAWDTCLESAGAHTVSVKATDAKGKVGSASAPLTVDHSSEVPALSGTGDLSSARLTFSTCGSPSSFNLYWAKGPGVTTSSTRISGVTSPYAHTGLTTGPHYFYRVAAVHGGVEGPLSKELEVALTSRICSKDRWCWENPLPHGAWIGALWGSSATDVWAGALWGGLFHFDGSAWSSVESGTGAWIKGIWGSAPNDVWAVCAGGTQGDAKVLHFDGSRWSSVAPPVYSNLHAVWGSGPKDVWAVGDTPTGAVLRWDGTMWSKVSSGFSGTVRGVWGSGASDVWFVGDGGTVLRWDGTAMKKVPSGTGATLFGVWGSGSNDVWTVGGSGAIAHWNGSTWSPVASGAGTFLQSIWGANATDVWAAGYGGTLVHWDGKKWGAVSSGIRQHLFAVWGSKSTDVWAGGDKGATTRWNGTAWSSSRATYDSPVSGGGLMSVWGSGPDDVWAVGSAGDVVHWDGTQWLQDKAAPYGRYYSVWGSGPNDVWALGGPGESAHWDGLKKTWDEVQTNVTEYLWGLWGAGPKDVWAAGDNGTLAHWNGTDWSKPSASVPTSNHLYSLSGSGPSDVWAVGASGTILRWNGTNWSAVASGTTQALWSVSARGPSDVWAVGSAGTVLRWNGTAWMGVPGTSKTWLIAVGGSGPSDVWAVGSNGEVYHWDGTAWSARSSGVRANLHGLWVGSSNDAWVVGEGGLILRYRP
jgi:hypothetical protein